MLLKAIARIAGNGRAAAVVAALMLIPSGEALSQDGAASEPPAAQLAPQPPAEATAEALPAQPQPPPAAASSSSRPGLIDALGGLLRNSADGVSSSLKDTHQRIQDLNKGTMDTLTSIPVTGFASGRSLCPRSANGARTA